MAEDDELTQRERRAQRHSQNRRRDMPANLKRNLRAYGPVALILLAIVGAAAGVFYFLTPKGCVEDHWHASFGIFVPDEEGNPMRVDFQTPRTPGGLHYYDYSSTNLGGASSFSMTLHMHITGSEAQGPAALGPAQFHMETPGKCIGVRAALRVVDVQASEDSLILSGGHTQVPGQSGEFNAEGDQSLRYWVESIDRSTCAYSWEQRSWSSVRNYQLQDGEALLVALGTYNDTQVEQMQSEIPAPISRDQSIIPRCMAEMAGTTTSSTTTSVTGNATTSMTTDVATGNATTTMATDTNTTTPAPPV